MEGRIRKVVANGTICFLPRLAAWPTPHGHTVNCAPVRRYLMSSVPEICPWLQHPPGTGRHSLPCIAMHPRRNHQGVFSRYGQGKVPETALRPQKRAEGLYGGAGKNSYVKFEYSAKSVRSPRVVGCEITINSTAESLSFLAWCFEPGGISMPC